MKTLGAFARLLPASSLQASPWKNGGGTTKEITLFPQGADFAKADFLWRLSSASITAPGAFSLFPDFHRVLLLIHGEELVLRFPKTKKILTPGMVLQFSGDDLVEAELPKGPVTDLGLIYDPDQVLAKVTIVELDRRPRSFALSSPYLFLFTISGDLMAKVYPGEREFVLNPGDTLQMDPMEQERIVHLDPGSGRVRLAAIEIAVISPASSS